MTNNLFLVATLFLLSVLDGFFTLSHSTGLVGELNPLMSYFLGKGTVPFLSAKLGLSLFAATVFALFLPRFKWGKALLLCFIFLYASVCSYHLLIFALNA